MSELQQLSVSATAPGKINLYFAVGDVQANGYHPVASLYSAVSLQERVTVTATEASGISLSLEIVPGSALAAMEQAGEFDRAGVPLNHNNLAYRAAEAVLEAHSISSPAAGLHLHIEKEVPVAGGMAGGSADAAAALKAVNEFVVKAGWADTELTRAQLMTLGASLGADVPFCVLGGLAVGYGVGEELTPITVPEETRQLPLVMVLNDRGLSTPSVFAELDRARAAGDLPAGGELTVPAELVAELTRGGELDARRIAELMRNDLQAPALALAPELRQTLTAGNTEDVAAAFVSGSGPTVAWLVANDETARSLVQTPGGHRRVFCTTAF